MKKKCKIVCPNCNGKCNKDEPCEMCKNYGKISRKQLNVYTREREEILSFADYIFGK